MESKSDSCKRDGCKQITKDIQNVRGELNDLKIVVDNLIEQNRAFRDFSSSLCQELCLLIDNCQHNTAHEQLNRKNILRNTLQNFEKSYDILKKSLEDDALVIVSRIKSCHFEANEGENDIQHNVIEDSTETLLPTTCALVEQEEEFEQATDRNNSADHLSLLQPDKTAVTGIKKSNTVVKHCSMSEGDDASCTGNYTPDIKSEEVCDSTLNNFNCEIATEKPLVYHLSQTHGSSGNKTLRINFVSSNEIELNTQKRLKKTGFSSSFANIPEIVQNKPMKKLKAKCTRINSTDVFKSTGSINDIDWPDTDKLLEEIVDIQEKAKLKLPVAINEPITDIKCVNNCIKESGDSSNLQDCYNSVKKDQCNNNNMKPDASVLTTEIFINDKVSFDEIDITLNESNEINQISDQDKITISSAANVTLNVSCDVMKSDILDKSVQETILSTGDNLLKQELPIMPNSDEYITDIQDTNLATEQTEVSNLQVKNKSSKKKKKQKRENYSAEKINLNIADKNENKKKQRNIKHSSMETKPVNLLPVVDTCDITSKNDSKYSDVTMLKISDTGTILSESKPHNEPNLSKVKKVDIQQQEDGNIGSSNFSPDAKEFEPAREYGNAKFLLSPDETKESRSAGKCPKLVSLK